MLGRALVALVLLLLTALAALWGWAGSEGSLATVLRLATRELPAPMQLDAREVRGTLLHGGQIGQVHFSQPGLALQLQGLRIAWQPLALLHGELLVTELHAQRIALAPQPRPDPEPEESTPLQQVVLPLRISTPLSADEIVWSAPGEGAPPTITALRGHYDWDGREHRLRIDELHFAEGNYQLQASLQGAAPMQLEAALQASLQARLAPDGAPVAASAQLRAAGPLSGRAARLALSAQLKGEDGNPLQAQASATVLPWAAQPLHEASAQLQALNLALLWPGAPQTALAGQLSLQPQEQLAQAGWALQADLTNDLAGPWDAGRLPLSALQASARFDGSLLALHSARLEVGSGHIELQQARYELESGKLQARLGVHALNPALLHRQLQAAPVNGEISASGSLKDGLDLQASLSAAAAHQRDRWQFERLQLKARWQEEALNVSTLTLAALQARLQASELRLDLAARAGSGQLSASVPGASLQLQGELAPRRGKGEIELALKSAQALQEWLGALPLPLPLPSELTQAQFKGQGQLQAQWQGGWQTLLDAAQGKSAADAPTLQATLELPQLDYRPAAGAPLALRQLQARLEGTPANMALSLGASASQGQDEAMLSASVQLRGSAGVLGQGRWQAQLSELSLQARQGRRPGPWRLQLQAPLTLAVQSAGGLKIETGPLAARLQGPQAGSATLQADPVQLSLPSGGDQPSALRLSSHGSLRDLPLAWANALDAEPTPLLQRLGLGGDLVLAADWDVQMGEALQASVTLRRSGGDLQLPIEGQSSAAGLRQLQLQMLADERELKLDAAWDSERAGQASAEARLPLERVGGAWRLAQDAPLSGSAHAALPDVGVWSMFAPPGWRVHGSLGAQVQLAGSLGSPQLSGTLSADDFAVRSVIDGIDLRDGRVRARLQGEQLQVTELFVRGGSGSGARILGPSGNLTRAPSDGGSLRGSGLITWQGAQVRMDMNAEAEALQLLVRADRQLSLSGKLHAQLQDGQLMLSGQLKADRASILLPDDSAPKLSDDVVVHGGDAPTEQTEEDTRVHAASAPAMDIELDLGDDFAVQGHGLTTRLKGQLRITSDGKSGPMPRVLGEIRTEQGRYRAWGQVLDVETGLLRFSGAADNPQLDILALRPQISERVGVQVSGSALAPRARLYSDPEMPDAEKLSWLVLGRSAAAGGAEAALMQQAALALLSGGGDPAGGVAQRLGLDEIGFRGPDGASGLNGAALTLGKRLSRRLYVAYEHSLAGAMGTLYIFLDLSRSLTLRGQTGAQSALDLIYTLRYD
ncbi:translocation/assembly module TamB domain-containing protein [Comamonas sp. NLF-1-9]|uniref:translocation/assembly module TamB domain-containing protein n=1 Tax=Comamonas sp. NLF-1-9 TaxID=2853163 RepID=UPI001C451CBB|nr:translocation/assembly module TamB domain-containing protein [Comamonas sp. NLF-1-9]QXL84721.1 translocation/assembly module TamB domain-containing protein [Comamonas sp. NLF-1-9]